MATTATSLVGALTGGGDGSGATTASVQDPRLAELDRINRSPANAVPVGDARSHWVGCERVHPACREALTRERRQAP